MFQRKQHARLGEYVASGGSYQLAWASWAATTPPPNFFNKMAWGAEEKGFNTFGTQNLLTISEEKKKEEKNPSRDAFVTFS